MFLSQLPEQRWSYHCSLVSLPPVFKNWLAPAKTALSKAVCNSPRAALTPNRLYLTAAQAH